jgi:iron complex outermembrane receptor protein
VRYTSPQFEDDLNAQVLGAYAVLDVLARRRLPRGVSVFASVLNAFDRRYLVGRAGVDTVGTPRTVLAGVAFSAR